MIEKWITKVNDPLEISCPQVRFTPTALVDMRLAAMLCDFEISGMGKVGVGLGDVIIVKNAVILPQIGYAANTILDPEGQAIFLESLPREERADYKFWWHSHVNGHAYWSSTDRAAIAGFRYAEFWVSMVLNKWRQQRIRVDLFQPYRIIFDDLPLLLSEPVDEAALNELARDRRRVIRDAIDRNVTTRG